MSMRALFRLAGISLILGGLMAGISHLFHLSLPADPAQLAPYVRLSEPIHLLLFAGGTVVLLGWIGQYALHCSASGVIGLISFVCLFLGILLGDLLHCILEFSIFPILTSLAPYALPALAEATYQSMPLAALLRIGQFLTFLGVPATAIYIYRSRLLPMWSAVPFALTAALFVLCLIPQFADTIYPASSSALYVSMALLGVAVIRSVRTRDRSSASMAVK